MKVLEKTAQTGLEAMAARLAVLEREIESMRRQLKAVEASVPENRAAFCLVSGDFEKVLTVLVLAHAAAAMEMDVTVFFAFWGVQAVKRGSRFRGKAPIEKALTAMLKSDISCLESSKFNFAGVGPKIFERLMKSKGIATPADLIAGAREAGIGLEACTMSMDVLGIAQDELMEGVGCCGAAQYMEAAARSRVAVVL